MSARTRAGDDPGPSRCLDRRSGRGWRRRHSRRCDNAKRWVTRCEEKEGVEREEDLQ